MQIGKTIMCIFVLISLIAATIYNHEVTHIQIIESYGITEYKINYQWSKITIEHAAAKCTDSCKLANSINEIIGYNVMPFLMLITFFMFLILIDEKK